MALAFSTVCVWGFSFADVEWRKGFDLRHGP
jgi:hypothetical protein